MTLNVFKSMAGVLSSKRQPADFKERPEPVNQDTRPSPSGAPHISFGDYIAVHGGAIGWLTEEAKRQFEAGRSYVLMEVLFICAVTQIIVPEWAVDALLDAHERLLDGRYGDLNEAFGKPPLSKASRKAKSRRQSSAGAVIQRLGALRVGESFNLSRDDLERAAQRMRDDGLDVSNDDVREIYRTYGQGLKSISPAEGKDFNSAFSVLPLREWRRRGRPLVD